MADGGVKMGLTRDMALKLSIQTMKGASEMMQKQYGLKHHMQMKDEVNIKKFNSLANIVKFILNELLNLVYISYTYSNDDHATSVIKNGHLREV